MKFANFICPEAIRADLKMTDKEGVISRRWGNHPPPATLWTR